ncbi:hypothetical protein [Burkholderia sp. LMG 13014]|uniref:hypothetical protein n=1 Tax=Burkholderia sp. LMG 13014 TaxID=2709306 RepID=UPI00196488FE|nr:hypothetical protein [Burkholderia sp. LMG 13014]
MFDLFEKELTPAQKKKRAAAQAQARREDEAFEEKKRQKDLEDVTSTFEMPLLLRAAELAGWKPNSHQDAMRKQAEGATLFLMSLATESKHKSCFELITQLIAMDAMSSNYELEPEEKKRPSPLLSRKPYMR